MSTPQQDAQRELEQRALRNVRSLVDNIDASEERDTRVQKRLLAAIIVGAVLVALTIAVVAIRHEKPQPVVIDPANLPPIQPGRPAQ